MTAAFLCAECGIDNSVIENSAAYLQGWMKALKGDSKLVVTAASQAQKRVYQKRGEQYLLIKSPPASGKSRALMFVALDKLHNHTLLAV